MLVEGLALQGQTPFGCAQGRLRFAQGDSTTPGKPSTGGQRRAYDAGVTKRGLLIVNPTARGAPSMEKLREAAGDLEGCETQLVATEGVGHATELARDAAGRGLDAVVACGGDGTVNEVANGLAGSATALAVVRGGTANVWAKEAGVPRKAAQALRLLTEGETRTIDLGRAGDRLFVLMAGVGFDADIIRGLSGRWKRRLGAAAYVASGLRQAVTYRETEAALRANGRVAPEHLYWLLIGNTRNYGGLLNLTYRAKVNDGRLDLCLLRRGGLHRLLWLLPWALLKRHDRRPEVRYEQIGSLEIDSPGLPVQLDGEYYRETPLRFEVAPAALRVITPRGLKSPLFGDES
ncbi:MAG: diacylglycerol kinase family protein [Dehalococcoidia bacterium]|nr:diacylglycerol kinase family protein [Dehalococcoidia bacterium]